MASFFRELQNTFISIGVKTVTATDVGKDAYVVDASQRAVLAKAGIEAGQYPDVTTFPLYIVGSDKTIEASYYPSIREGSGRQPEYRMGRFLHWVKEGDRLLLATDGQKVFAYKLKESDTKDEGQTEWEEKAVKTYEQIDPNLLLKKAKAATPKPKQHETTTNVYERNLAVKAYVLFRSGCKCELPGCTYTGFEKTNGGLYIEEHHITPLAEGGEDTVSNTVALCPNHHAQAHFSKNKDTIKNQLHGKITSL
jgi:5-methylcytosine-specific restriction endonuclease McrA